jgi:hypothetical protein
VRLRCHERFTPVEETAKKKEVEGMGIGRKTGQERMLAAMRMTSLYFTP